jgi:hypothetical protein
MTKLSKGNLVACETCGLKMVVVAACAEGECELVCCGQPMTAAGAAPAGDWTQFAQAGAPDWQKFASGTGSEDWKKHAETPAPQEGKKRGKK